VGPKLCRAAASPVSDFRGIVASFSVNTTDNCPRISFSEPSRSVHCCGVPETFEFRVSAEMAFPSLGSRGLLLIQKANS
jgi:hypothetical protein